MKRAPPLVGTRRRGWQDSARLGKRGRGLGVIDDVERHLRRLGEWGAFSALFAISACAAHESSAPARAENPKTASAASCSLGERSAALVPASRASGTVAFATLGGQALAFIADEDAQRVTVVDVDSGKELASAELRAAPGALLVLPTGMVAVTLPQRSQVQLLAFDGKSLGSRCAVPTPAEPVALALSPDARTLFVASAWAHRLTAYSSATLGEQYQVELGREPRAIVIDDAG